MTSHEKKIRINTILTIIECLLQAAYSNIYLHLV